MEFVRDLGKVRIYSDQPCEDSEEISIIAYKNGEMVVSETYHTKSVDAAVKHMLNHVFDAYTLADICCVLPSIGRSSDGAIFGVMPGRRKPERFFRVGESEFYEHAPTMALTH